MNRLINLIIVKRINHNINKFAIAKFVHDHKQQFVSGKINTALLYKLHSMMWTNIIKYYDNYIFGPIRIDKVKSKILKRLIKDIKKQTFSIHLCDRSKSIDNLETLFNTVHKRTHNCFACYYSQHKIKNSGINLHYCTFCPVEKWRKRGVCYEYSQLYKLTFSKKDFKLHKQYIINLCKEIRDLEWVTNNEKNKIK